MSLSYLPGQAIITHHRCYIVASPASADAARITVREWKNGKAKSTLFRIATADITGRADGFITEEEDRAAREWGTDRYGHKATAARTVTKAATVREDRPFRLESMAKPRKLTQSRMF